MGELKSSTIREMLKMPQTPDSISFSAGNPSPLTFPHEEMAKIAADIFINDYQSALQYGITAGYEPLRETIKQRMSGKYGIGSGLDDVIVTSGGQQV